jgi:hypothetical protein
MQMAIGFWPKANRESEKRALFIPKGNSLVMIVFHLGPIPELELRNVIAPSTAQQAPPAIPSGGPALQQPSTSSPAVAHPKPPQQLSAQAKFVMSLPPEQRALAVDKIRQALAAQNGGDPASMQGSSGNAAALAAFTQRQLPTTGGMNAGPSAEMMMQHFMQRGPNDGTS